VAAGFSRDMIVIGVDILEALTRLSLAARRDWRVSA